MHLNLEQACSFAVRFEHLRIHLDRKKDWVEKMNELGMYNWEAMGPPDERGHVWFKRQRYKTTDEQQNQQWRHAMAAARRSRRPKKKGFRQRIRDYFERKRAVKGALKIQLERDSCTGD